MSSDSSRGGGLIAVKSIDDTVDTIITISCYRETSRLQRMLDVYNKALTLADEEGHARLFRTALLRLHDHKGVLVVTWRNVVDFARFRRHVDAAWNDECEVTIVHQDQDGLEITYK